MMENLDAAQWVHQVLVEKGWVGASLLEDLLYLFVLEFLDWPTEAEQPLHLFIYLLIYYAVYIEMLEGVDKKWDGTTGILISIVNLPQYFNFRIYAVDNALWCMDHFPLLQLLGQQLRPA